MAVQSSSPYGESLAHEECAAPLPEPRPVHSLLLPHDDPPIIACPDRYPEMASPAGWPAGLPHLSHAWSFAPSLRHPNQHPARPRLGPPLHRLDCPSPVPLHPHAARLSQCYACSRHRNQQLQSSFILPQLENVPSASPAPTLTSISRQAYVLHPTGSPSTTDNTSMLILTHQPNHPARPCAN